ncbi:MAG TPA: TSUP family transporter [Myxococcota bacterium]|nr:TSUP family transporter [Myxococcota bacterium]
MTAFLLLGVAALAVSALTLFSGFGLGTLLMPVFALFFPAPVAVASTAVVHAANNLFKLGLLSRHARREVIVPFGLPAIGAAAVGAAVLGALAALEPLWEIRAAGLHSDTTPLELVLGVLILGFAAVELAPGLGRLRISRRWLPLGGLVSGFFGGLSGHQGAFRAAFLAALGLSPAELAATQAVLACLVDAARLAVYAVGFALAPRALATGFVDWRLVAFASLCAFAGSVLASRLIAKATLAGVRVLTGALLVITGSLLALGFT